MAFKADAGEVGMAAAAIPGTDAIAIELFPQGMACVDADLGVEVEKLFWRLNNKTRSRPRAFIYHRKGSGSRRLYLERFVTKAPKDKFVRFLNRNTLDCRSANLEIVDSRRELLLPDQTQRTKWKNEEIASGVINLQRRREDAWRIFCQGKEISDIAYMLNSKMGVIWQDIREMAVEPRFDRR